MSSSYGLLGQRPSGLYLFDVSVLRPRRPTDKPHGLPSNSKCLMSNVSAMSSKHGTSDSQGAHIFSNALMAFLHIIVTSRSAFCCCLLAFLAELDLSLKSVATSKFHGNVVKPLACRIQFVMHLLLETLNHLMRSDTCVLADLLFERRSSLRHSSKRAGKQVPTATRLLKLPKKRSRDTVPW